MLLLRKSDEALELVAQGGGGVTIPGGDHVDVALRDVVSGHGGGGLMV